MSSSGNIQRASTMKHRAYTFVEAAQKDAETIKEVCFTLYALLAKDEPLIFTIKDGSSTDSKEIYMDGLDIRINQETGASVVPSICVLSILNYHTFPVTATLDSITLSQKGKLDDALDVRPFMFSGPAPTMVIWAGSNRDSIESLGYPTLSDEDAKQAFAYWLRYIFGVNLQDDGKLA